MSIASIRKGVRSISRDSRRVLNRNKFAGPRCEALESRRLLSAFTFSTGVPDGKIGTIGEPPNAHNSDIEFESADDFVTTTDTVITHASFTGLLTGGATLTDVSNVF